MARETIGYTRLEWICPNCSGKNPGPEKTCTTCGAPQPKNVVFQSPDKDELVTDTSEIEKAKLAPDIHCPYCGTRNPADAPICRQCGGDLKGGEQRTAGQELGILNQSSVDLINCPSCATPNPSNSLRCTKCGAPLRPANPIKPDENNRKKIPIWAYIFGGLLLLVLLGGGFCLFNKLFERSEISAVVQNVSWQRSINIEKFGPVSKDNWKDSIPSGAIIGSCEWRVHHTQDQPAANSEKVCSAPKKIDKGNGYSEVVQDCNYQVKQEYCKFSVNELFKSNEVVAKGVDLNPYWPNPKLTDNNMRLGTKSESFLVNFSGNGKNYSYNPDATNFSQFLIGSKWKLSVNGFDSIQSIKKD